MLISHVKEQVKHGEPGEFHLGRSTMPGTRVPDIPTRCSTGHLLGNILFSYPHLSSQYGPHRLWQILLAAESSLPNRWKWWWGGKGTQMRSQSQSLWSSGLCPCSTILVTQLATRFLVTLSHGWGQSPITVSLAVAENLYNKFYNKVWPTALGTGSGCQFPGAGVGPSSRAFSYWCSSSTEHGLGSHPLVTHSSKDSWPHLSANTTNWAGLSTQDGSRLGKRMPTLFYYEIRLSSPSDEGKPSNAFNISASPGRLLSFLTRAQKTHCFSSL